MLHHFLLNNRDELTARCRIKVGHRPGRSATEVQLQNGIPLFLDQLIRTLVVEQTPERENSELISGPAGGGVALSEVGASASQHGKDLLELGLTVDQVVHDYGDLCQSITDLAVEQDAPFEVDEFRTLNRCLDNAISDAVSEFGYQRDGLHAARYTDELNQRIGFFAHELRNLLGTASLAFAAAKAGNLSFTGATGSILERSLNGLEKLITNSIQDVRSAGQTELTLNSFSLAGFIQEIYDAAMLSAQVYGCALRTLPVDADLAVRGTRDLLIAAVANLLQNAFKFTEPGTEVLLTAYAQGDRILIDVKDHCGGLSTGVADTMFLPFSQAGTNRTGIGLGLTIAKQTVAANDGTLTVHSLDGIGCVFTISLPRHSIPT
ncbi:sensor histidine kinase KdpD [Janthinobacterium sp. PAMC25594]|uniref:sensor histidine kinase n=1 Tax=Janthinobacterium sp. PAMC25594 TaxID=2861284 RepID=UPI001C626595|nr:HAMP domain-containing sensor histidine kinase [Janthinobacterium sp. PAMC25594]QYG08881.1 HAMP domain-containing histidine kinase [Janthinobacterium sp. PAMC25594]